jgi:hypothetical protein
MTLDKTFESEIKKAANGDGSREYKFELIDELKKVSAALANRYDFDSCVQNFGRTKVALCVAVTIMSATYRYEEPQITWAQAVITLWTNKCERSISTAIINIHHSILSDISSGMRKLTVKE